MMKLIDSHIHFYDPAKMYYEWLDDFETLNRPILPDSLPTSGSDWEIEQMIVVEAEALPEQNFQEVRWINTLAESDQRIGAIVAYVSLENHNFHAALEVMKDLPRVKGIRRSIQSEGRGFATKEHFIDAVRALSDYGFTFDISALANQLPDVIRMVEHCPNVQFALDHLGKPDIKDGEIDIWRTQIKQLAAFENVHCKFSGILVENWQLSDLQPYVNDVLEAFGTDRLMFGGDYPMLQLAGATYTTWVNAARDTLKSLSADEQQKIFYTNAKRFYRL